MNAIVPPVMTTNISYQTAISDEILVNRDGSTGVQTTSDLAVQLAATSPLDLAGFQAPLFATEAALNGAVLTNKVSAWVFNDPDADKNGVWSWTGAAWVWTLPLPYSISVLHNAGAGTANAIVATSNVPLVEGLIVVLPITATTTASPVRVKINGSKTFNIKTLTGNEVVPGGLVEGMVVLALVSAETLRLVNDQVSAAIVAAAEAAAAQAKIAAAQAGELVGLAETAVQPDNPLLVNAAQITRLPVNIKDRGVLGNGTNETAAIQAANNYAQSVGRTLYFPAGTYMADKLTQTTDWIGENRNKSVLKASGRTYPHLDYFITTSTNGVRLEALGIDFSSAVCPPNTLDANIVSASGTGSVCTLVLDQPVVYPIGQYITVWKTTDPSVTDIGAASYFGLFTVTASSAGSVSYAHTATGALPVAGKIQANPGNIYTVYRAFMANDWVVDDCHFFGLYDHILAIGINAGNGWVVRNSEFTNSVPSVQQSQAVNVSVASGGVSRYKIINNKMDGTGIFTNGSNGLLAFNDFDNIGFGSAICLGPLAGCISNQVIGNHAIGGHGMDVNYTYVSGVECWSGFSIISGNYIFGNSGHGISLGATDVIIANNIILNNGNLNGSGICNYSIAGGYSGTNAVISGNICRDTRGSPKQSYGYAEFAISGVIQNVTLTDNTFIGNALGTMLHSSELFSFRGPNYAKRYAGVVVGTVNSGVTFVTTQTFAGARLGDRVSVSMSVDHLGCQVYGEVDATNQISIFVKNLTGSNQVIGTVTFNVTVEKPIAYVN